MQAKVNAVNAAHALANRLYHDLANALTPLVGLPVTKQDGTLLAKVQKLLPDLPNNTKVRVTRFPGKYSLAWTVQTNEPDDTFHGQAVYYETTVYVGKLHDNTLDHVYTWTTLRTDFTAAEVRAKQEAVKKAEQRLRDAQGNLLPFDMRD